MFSKDGLKKLAEQAQKAGNRLATNAGGTTNTWFAGQISPEKGGYSFLPSSSVFSSRDVSSHFSYRGWP